MKNFTYVLPSSLAEASTEAMRKNAVLRAGGQDLIDMMKSHLIEPERLVNLSAVPGLRDVAEKEGALHLGALVTLAEVAAHPRVPKALAQAADDAATPQIRNVATLGGNLCQRPRCWYFRDKDTHCLRKGGTHCFAMAGDNRYHAIFDNSPCCIVHPSNAATALVALDAKVVTTKRTIPIEELFVLPVVDVPREHVLAPGEILTHVVVPLAGAASAYREAREKQSFDWGLVSAAVALRLRGDIIEDARVCVGNASPVPHRSREAEEILKGGKATQALASKAATIAFDRAHPLTHNAYKVPLGRALLRRTILAAAGREEGGV